MLVTLAWHQMAEHVLWHGKWSVGTVMGLYKRKLLEDVFEAS